MIESQRITVGAGTGNREDVRSTVAHWSRTAYGNRLRTARAKATPEALVSIGIGVRGLPDGQ